MKALLFFLLLSLSYAQNPNCTSINVSTEDNTVHLIQEGVVTSEWSTIDERANDFAFNLSVSEAISAAQLHITSDLKEAVTIAPLVFTKHPDGKEQYSYNVVCNDMISHRVKITVKVDTYNVCPPVSFSWTKICGTGEPEPRKGFAITIAEDGDKLIVKDGIVMDKDFMENTIDSERKPISKHNAQLTLKLHLFPIPEDKPSGLMTLSEAKEIIKSSNYSEAYITTPINMKAPYAYYEKNILYPVIKDEGARPGELTVEASKKLIIDFNCLGVEVQTTIILYIEIPLFETVKLFIAKECTKETLVDRLAEKIVAEEEKYGILKLLIMCLILCLFLYMTITCYNLCKGKKLVQAVPCGGSIVACCTGSGTDVEEVSNQSMADSRIVTGNSSELNKLPRDDKLEVEPNEDDGNYFGNTYGSI